MIIYCHALLDEPLTTKLSETLSGDHELLFRSEELSDQQAKAYFLKADYILGNPPVAWFSEPTPQLKFWQLDSAGFDQYSDISLSPDVKVANMGDWFARPCAETIVGGVLALYRGIDTLTLLKQKPEWVGSKLRTSLKILYNQNVIILGAGTIGQAAAAMLRGFSCSVHMMARTSPDADLHTREELMHALPLADLVVNTLPGTAAHFVDAAFLKAMKKGSVYSSVGRGSTTDEAALLEELNNGHLDGAVLDVTETEPIPDGHPLWQLPHVILTQHTGGGHMNEHMGKVDLFLNNIFSLHNGGSLANEVSLTKGY